MDRGTKAEKARGIQDQTRGTGMGAGVHPQDVWQQRYDHVLIDGLVLEVAEVTSQGIYL